jgi:hypothetical protein
MAKIQEKIVLCVGGLVRADKGENADEQKYGQQADERPSLF